MIAGRASVLAVLLVLCGDPARAQGFSYERETPRATQSLNVVLAPVRFVYAGDENPAERFDFNDVVLGVAYTRPSVQLALAYGTDITAGDDAQNRMKLIDASFHTWGDVGLSWPFSSGRSKVFVPVVLHSGYRRVAKSEAAASAIDAFSVTALGIGAGIGLDAQLAKLHLEARATPLIAIASRSFGDATGSSTMFDGDLMLHLGPLVGRFGLSFGYGFRAQRWKVGASNLLRDADDDLLHYTGTQHVFRTGLSW